MDFAATKQYYAQRSRDDTCSCDYCQNYIDEIKAAYPKFADFLASLGADAEIPFEVLLPIEADDEYFDYDGVQYLICGTRDGFEDTEIDGISVCYTDSHPSAAYQAAYFVIEAGTFHLKRRNDRYPFR